MDSIHLESFRIKRIMENTQFTVANISGKIVMQKIFNSDELHSSL